MDPVGREKEAQCVQETPAVTVSSGCIGWICVKEEEGHGFG